MDEVGYSGSWSIHYAVSNSCNLWTLNPEPGTDQFRSDYVFFFAKGNTINISDPCNLCSSVSHFFCLRLSASVCGQLSFKIFCLTADTRGLTQTTAECWSIELQGNLYAGERCPADNCNRFAILILPEGQVGFCLASRLDNTSASVGVSLRLICFYSGKSNTNLLISAFLLLKLTSKPTLIPVAFK